MVPRFLAYAVGTAALLSSVASAHAFDGVVASIKPIHSLVAGVMEGVGEPSLIVEGAASPHGYALRPSQAGALQDAKLVFWVGEGMENFLAEPLEALAGNATVVALGSSSGLVTLPYREGGAFEAHDHGDHDHGDQDEGDHDEGDHDHDAEAAAIHDHGEHHEDHGDGADEMADAGDDDHNAHDHDGHAGDGAHAHGGHDMHLWLDPENAKVMVGAIENALATADPENAAAYEANAQALGARLDELVTRTQQAVNPLKGKGFVVFHDAYHYFEHRFGIEAAGSITISPEVAPGARRISEIRDRIGELGAACVFSEPQFEPNLVAVVTEGTGARSGVLDPLGASLEDGPDLYFDLIDAMTTSLADCLAEAS